MRKLGFCLFIIYSLLTNFTFAQFELEEAFFVLSFNSPVGIYSAGDGTNRLFVVEQAGRIIVFKNDSTVSDQNTFLDIKERVSSGGEMGLLGLAFHPDFKNNGYFYIDYTTSNPRRTIISRFHVNQNSNSADPNSELILISQEQPYSNHNGGQTSFGPDGYLYIGFGDGGAGGDPENRAQNLGTILGKIIRIDVDNTQGDLNYAIPDDNPFKGNGQGNREEIFAYGLRNPWRFSFDPETKRLWCGDVGQDKWEEIDIIEKGRNYGWRITEGFHCYNPSSGCDTSGITMPVHEFGHNSNGGYSITGGFVYRGSNVPELNGKYVYGDYVSKKIWALEYDGQKEIANNLLTTAPGGISSFGVDDKNELYVCAFDGKIYRFKPTSPTGLIEKFDNKDFYLKQNYPNPFNPITNFIYNLPEESQVEIDIIDTEGKIVERLLNSVKATGNYSLKWDGKNFASGIYFIRMNAASQVSERRFTKAMKIVLLK